MEYDSDAEAFVTYVKELHGMSTYGATATKALDSTAEMIRGNIQSTESNASESFFPLQRSLNRNNWSTGPNVPSVSLTRTAAVYSRAAGAI